MDLLIAWIGCIGSWLIVAGSIYQAALELKDETIERERIKLAGAKVKPLPEVSVWWWFLPPVKLILEQKRSAQYRRAYFTAMNTADSATLVAFFHKATAWLYVALGGLCIALKETYDLMHLGQFNLTLYILVVIGLLIVAIANTVLSILQSNKLLAETSGEISAKNK